VVVTAYENTCASTASRGASSPSCHFSHIQLIVLRANSASRSCRSTDADRRGPSNSHPSAHASTAPKVDRHLRMPPTNTATLKDMILFEDADVMVLTSPRACGGRRARHHAQCRRHAGRMRDAKGQKPRLVHRLTGKLLLPADRENPLFATALTAHSATARGEKSTGRWGRACRAEQGPIVDYLAKEESDATPSMRAPEPGDEGQSQRRYLLCCGRDLGAKVAWVSLKPVHRRTHHCGRICA